MYSGTLISCMPILELNSELHRSCPFKADPIAHRDIVAAFCNASNIENPQRENVGLLQATKLKKNLFVSKFLIHNLYLQL